MECHVEIGDAHTFELRHAVLVYTGSRRAFASLHDITKQPEGAPLLGPARPLSMAFLRTLAAGLGSRIAPEILPVNVLARTPEMIVWWSLAARRVMFFGEADAEARKLNARVFPQPPLVFKLRSGELFVRALETNLRPEAMTRLKTAPYWNVGGEDGRVCLGTVRAPEEVSVASLVACEYFFFQTDFSHVLGAVRLTTHAGGFVGLWKSLAGKRRFPARYLVDALETLQEFVRRSVCAGRTAQQPQQALAIAVENHRRTVP
jgi:PRTRC genetic system protein B